jgi:hypothetical protein
VAPKALNIIKKNKPSGTNLKVFEIRETGSSYTAIGRSDGGLLHDSEIRVEIRSDYDDGSIIEVEANDDKFGRLLVRLRREL